VEQTGGTRSQLIRAALEIIDAGGAEALNMRGLGQRLGISRQAAYFHFADKRALVAAVAAEGMRRERKVLERAIAATSRPRDRLRAFALAHVRHWTRHPRLREVVHGREVHKSASEELQREAIRNFALFRETVAACFPAVVDVDVLRRRCVVLWGAVRGLVELHSDRVVPASVTGTVEDWVTDAIDALTAGWS